MCKPLYFSSVDYVINPWMKPGTIDEKKAMIQWENLVKAYQDLGVKVEVIDQKPDVADMVFSADQGIVKNGKVLLSHFQYPQRQGETKYYEKWFKDHGYQTEYLPDGINLEGNGVAQFWRDIIFVGIGYRTGRKACEFMEKVFGKKVIPLENIDPLFFHLDVGLFDLDENTIFYYPPAFSDEAIKILKERVPNLVKFSKEEIDNFASNSVVTDKHVICQSGNPTFEKKLNKLGYKMVEVDLSEFIKSGGGANCLTNILEEEIIN